LMLAVLSGLLLVGTNLLHLNTHPLPFHLHSSDCQSWRDASRPLGRQPSRHQLTKANLFGFPNRGSMCGAKFPAHQNASYGHDPKHTLILKQLRGGRLSVRSKRVKRRKSGRKLDPNFIRWKHERQLHIQRKMEQRLFPHLFPTPSKKHPARIAAGLEAPDPEPPAWQKHNLELQEKHGSLWYPRDNYTSDTPAKPYHVPGERTRREKHLEEYVIRSRIHQEFMLKNLFNATREEIVHDALDFLYQKKKIKKRKIIGPVQRISRIKILHTDPFAKNETLERTKIRLKPKLRKSGFKDKTSPILSTGDSTIQSQRPVADVVRERAEAPEEQDIKEAVEALA